LPVARIAAHGFDDALSLISGAGAPAQQLGNCCSLAKRLLQKQSHRAAERAAAR